MHYSAQQRQPSPTQQSAPGPAGYTLERVTEYVDALFTTYAGSVKNADVVHRARIIREIMSGRLSLALAELDVKMRPESKRYMQEQAEIRKQEQERKIRLERYREYVLALAAKYTPNSLPSENEVNSLVNALDQKTKSLQEVEDYFTMKTLNACPSVPHKKY